MIENESPELAARLDVLLLALVTLLKIRRPPNFDAVLAMNVQMWRDTLIASRVGDPYLAALDARLESLQSMLQG